MPANFLEENSRQMDRHKKRPELHMPIGNREVCAEVHVPQSGGDGAPNAGDGPAQPHQILGHHTVQWV